MNRTIEIPEEVFQKLKGQLEQEEIKDVSIPEGLVGKAWFFRTVTYHIVGRVTACCGPWLTLAEASWVADSGRFMSAIQDGTLSEVEPVGDWFVNLSTVTDFGPWRHILPTGQK